MLFEDQRNIQIQMPACSSHTKHIRHTKEDCCNMNLLSGCKLTYFGIPGRGEATRLALAIGGIPFEDHRIEFSQWKDFKAGTPWGSLPVLTLPDGKTEIAQQRAILRLVGTQSGLYPTDDPIRCAKIDSFMDACEDIGTKTNSQGQGLPQEEKEAARAKAFAKGGDVYNIFVKVQQFVETHGSGNYAVGDSMTIADLYLYSGCGMLVSGLYDGVPKDALARDFPRINAIRKTVREHPAVNKFYENLDAKYGAKMGESFHGPFA